MVFLLLSAGEVYQGVPLLKKLSYGIGYSGGLWWTGEDLAKPFEASPIAGIYQLPEYLAAHLYWLNSIEVNAVYSLNEKERIEVGVGYGWARIEKYSNVFYEFHLFPVWIGYAYKKSVLRLSYIYSYSPQYYYRYGYRISSIFQIAKWLYFRIDMMGRIWYIGRTTGSHVCLCLNGVGFIIEYNFKGGVR